MSRRRHKPLPKEPVTALITALSHEGRGICQIDGKTTFVQGALPGETVTFKYTRQSRQVDEGQFTQVEQSPNPDRVTPKCAVYDMCGGCSLQHLSMPAQLKLKQATLLEQLAHFGSTKPEKIIPPTDAKEWGYRTKARIGVRNNDKKEKVLVGFRERNGRYITNMDQCEVLDPRVGYKIEALSQLIASLDTKKDIPQIEVAISDEVTSLIFRNLVDLTEEDTKKLIQFSIEHNVQIYNQPNKPQPLASIAPKDGENHALLSYPLAKHKIEILFHPTDFTQVNYDINQQMIDLALDLLELKSSDHVLDLFCGIGNFTLPIARYCEKVIGVEGAESAVERAKTNTQHNNINNAEFYVDNLFEDCSQRAWAKQQYNKLIIDPPRSGAEEILSLIPSLKPERIVYVSCNPATLARDAGTLTNKYGYTLKQAGIMNMFPHTSHVESIALFIKE